MVSVTEILTDGARNVIPSHVTIKGDCRAMSPETQELMESRMRELATGIASAHGAEAEVEYRHDFIVTANSPAETDAAIATARKVAGESAVDANCQPHSVSEDFARMLQIKPGCYILIGNGQKGHCGETLHNPNYDLNDEILAVGADYWVALAESQLAIG